MSHYLQSKIILLSAKNSHFCKFCEGVNLATRGYGAFHLFSKYECVNAIYSLPVGTSTYRTHRNKSLIMALNLEMTCSGRARGKLSNRHRTKTCLNAPFGGND